MRLKNVAAVVRDLLHRASTVEMRTREAMIAIAEWNRNDDGREDVDFMTVDPFMPLPSAEGGWMKLMKCVRGGQARF